MKLVAALLWIVSLGALLVPIYEPPALHSGAYVQDVGARSAVVAYIGAAKETLELGWDVEPGVRDDGARAVGRLSSGQPRRRVHWRLDGLEPATAYRFRITVPAGQPGAGAVVDEGSFRTFSVSDDARVRFVVCGDSGAQPPWVWFQQSPLCHWVVDPDWLPPAGAPAAIGRMLAAAKPDFWLHVGDVVYPRGQNRHYRTGLFRPFAEVLRTTPCFAVLGNHDVMEDGGTQFLQNFVLPENPVTGDERCYTVRHGPLRVIVLDLNRQVDGQDPAMTYLRSELEAATEPWIVVASHYPIKSVYREVPRTDLEQHLIPLLERYRVDLVMAGHDHNYQRFGGPGDHPIQIVTGGGGKNLYPVRRRPPGLAVAVTAHHLTRVEIEGRKLVLEAVALDGAVLDRLVIDKRALWRSGRLELDPDRARDRRVLALVR